MGVIIDIETCTACGLCVKSCPYGAVEVVDKTAVINERCTSCGACIEPCPVEAITTDLPPRELADPDRYQGIWVWAEVQDGNLSRTAYELLGCARGLASELGHDVSAVLIGNKVEPLAGRLFAYGADRVFLAEGERIVVRGQHTLKDGQKVEIEE